MRPESTLNDTPAGMTDAEWRGLMAEGEALLAKGCELERAGDVEQAVEVLMRALGLLAGHGNQPLGADLLYRSGVLRARLGQTDEAEDLFDQSLETASWCEYKRGQAYATNGLAAVAQRRGDIDAAEALYRRAGRLASETGEHRLSGMVEQNLGVLANIRGDLDSALVHYRSALAPFERADDTEALCWVLNNMGMLETDLGRYDDAEPVLRESLAMRRRLFGDDNYEVSQSLNNVALFLHEIGRPMVMSSLVLGFGFGIMVFSTYGTLIRIGAMLSLATIVALVCDMLVTPALLALLKNNRNAKKKGKAKVASAEPAPEGA